MNLITANDLNAARAVLNESLPGTAVVQNFTTSSDSGGGVTETWTAAGTYPCRFGPATLGQMEERERGERISPEADFIFTLPGTATITSNSRIIHAGGTYNVEAVRDRSWPVSTRVEVRKATA